MTINNKFVAKSIRLKTKAKNIPANPEENSIMVVNKLKLKGKKVLVTGADGFIGSHVVEELLKTGATVRAFVYYNSFNSWGWLDSFSKAKLSKVEVFAGDIRYPNGVYKAM